MMKTHQLSRGGLARFVVPNHTAGNDLGLPWPRPPHGQPQNRGLIDAIHVHFSLCTKSQSPKHRSQSIPQARTLPNKVQLITHSNADKCRPPRTTTDSASCAEQQHSGTDCHASNAFCRTSTSQMRHSDTSHRSRSCLPQITILSHRSRSCLLPHPTLPHPHHHPINTELQTYVR